MCPETSPPNAAFSSATFFSMKLWPTLHIIGSAPRSAIRFIIAWENFTSVMTFGFSWPGFCLVRSIRSRVRSKSR